MSPIAALTDEQPYTDQGAKNPDRSIEAAIVLVLVYQHVSNGVSGVQQEAGATEERALQNLFLVSYRRVDRDAVRAHAPGQLERAHVLRSWVGLGRDEEVRPGHCCVNHKPTLQVSRPHSPAEVYSRKSYYLDGSAKLCSPHL